MRLLGLAILFLLADKASAATGTITVPGMCRLILNASLPVSSDDIFKVNSAQCVTDDAFNDFLVCDFQMDPRQQTLSCSSTWTSNRDLIAAQCAAAGGTLQGPAEVICPNSNTATLQIDGFNLVTGGPGITYDSQTGSGSSSQKVQSCFEMTQAEMMFNCGLQVYEVLAPEKENQCYTALGLAELPGQIVSEGDVYVPATVLTGSGWEPAVFSCVLPEKVDRYNP